MPATGSGAASGITTGDALQQITDLAETTAFPALTDAQVQYCVSQAARRDSSGYDPTDTNWTPTYDIAAGVSLAWTLKAGKAAAKYDFSTDNQKLSRSQIHQHCLEMAALWEGQMQAQTGTLATYEDVTVNADDVDPLYGLSNVRLF